MARKKMEGKRKEDDDLGLGNSFINESLCNEYHRLSYLCRRLKRDGRAKDTWFFNNKLFLTDMDGKKHHIEHINDLYKFSTLEVIEQYLKC